jgi:hypothetical protein
MAYIDANLCHDYQFGKFKNTRWSYDTVDAVADVNTAGYFSAANQAPNRRRIQIGDEILVTQWTTAVPTTPHPIETSAITARSLMVVVQVDDDTGVIDVANGDARTLTDSD